MSPEDQDDSASHKHSIECGEYCDKGERLHELAREQHRIQKRLEKQEVRIATANAAVEELHSDVREIKVSVGIIHRIVTERVDPALELIQKGVISDYPKSENTGMHAMYDPVLYSKLMVSRKVARLLKIVLLVMVSLGTCAAAVLEIIHLFK